MKWYKFIFISVFFIAVSIWFVKTNILYKNLEPDLMVLLKQKVQENYLDKVIKDAISKENYDEADEYYNLANDYNFTLLPSTLELISECNSTTDKALRDAKSFTNGFISGDADNGVALVGSMASDMTVVGDIRDITTEGGKLANGEDYDEFILSLGILGVAMSASQFLTAGSSTPAKVGTSILKIAKKSGKLSRKFIKVLKTSFSKIIDVKKVKKIQWSNPKKSLEMLTKMTKTLNLTTIEPIFEGFSKITKNTSLVDTVKLVEYVDDTNDLKKIARVSSKFKRNTKTVLKIVGKGTLRATKRALQWTTNLIIGFISLVISTLSFIFSIWMLYRTGGKVKRYIV